jgi:3-oxoadipate enol-lactonase
MTMVEVGDTALYYEASGTGPAMVFVHGMCGDATVWAGQASRFSDRFTCVRYDRRGHSRSRRGRAPVGVARHADDAAALIESLDLAPCLLVASSSGAVIAVDLAIRYGRLLRGVVLSEPPLFSLDADGRRAVGAEFDEILQLAATADGQSAAVDAFFTLMCPGLWAILDDTGKGRYRANAAIGFADLRSPPLDVTPADLRAITIPVLVIAGYDSHPVLRSVARLLAIALPDARLVELPHCGHVTYAEQPGAFAHAVSIFAGELDRRTAFAPNVGVEP